MATSLTQPSAKVCFREYVFGEFPGVSSSITKPWLTLRLENPCLRFRSDSCRKNAEASVITIEHVVTALHYKLTRVLTAQCTYVTLKLSVNYCRTNTRKNFFSERVVKVLNSLPPSAVNFSSLATFRKSLNKINLRMYAKY